MSFSVFSEQGKYNKIKEYIEESLFCSLAENLEYFSVPSAQYTKIEAWYEAKKFVKELGEIKAPEFIIYDKMNELIKNHNCRNNCYIDENFRGVYCSFDLNENDANNILLSILMSIFTILYYSCSMSKEYSHFTKVIKKLYSKYNDNHFLTNIQNAMDKAMVDKEIVFDYDYIKGIKVNTEEENTPIIKETEEDKEEEDEETQVISVKLRVRLEFVLKLLNIDNIDIVPNKSALCRLLGTIMNEDDNIIRSTLFRTNKGKHYELNKNTHGIDVIEFNKLITDCKINNLNNFTIQLD